MVRTRNPNGVGASRTRTNSDKSVDYSGKESENDNDDKMKSNEVRVTRRSLTSTKDAASTINAAPKLRSRSRRNQNVDNSSKNPNDTNETINLCKQSSPHANSIDMQDDSNSQTDIQNISEDSSSQTSSITKNQQNVDNSSKIENETLNLCRNSSPNTNSIVINDDSNFSTDIQNILEDNTSETSTTIINQNIDNTNKIGNEGNETLNLCKKLSPNTDSIVIHDDSNLTTDIQNILEDNTSQTSSTINREHMNAYEQTENDQNIISIIEIVDENDGFIGTYVGNEEIIVEESTDKEFDSPIEDVEVSDIIEEDKPENIPLEDENIQQSESDSQINIQQDDFIECEQYYVEIVDSASQDGIVELEITSDEYLKDDHQYSSSPSLEPNTENNEVGSYEKNYPIDLIEMDPEDVQSSIELSTSEDIPSPDTIELSLQSFESETPNKKPIRTYVNKRKKKRSTDSMSLKMEEVINEVKDIEIDQCKKIIENQLQQQLTEKLSISESVEEKSEEIMKQEVINLIETHGEIQQEEKPKEIIKEEEELAIKEQFSNIIETTERRRSQRKKIMKYEVKNLFCRRSQKTNQNTVKIDKSSPKESEKKSEITSEENLPKVSKIDLLNISPVDSNVKVIDDISNAPTDTLGKNDKDDKLSPITDSVKRKNKGKNKTDKEQPNVISSPNTAKNKDIEIAEPVDSMKPGIKKGKHSPTNMKENLDLHKKERNVTPVSQPQASKVAQYDSNNSSMERDVENDLKKLFSQSFGSDDESNLLDKKKSISCAEKVSPAKVKTIGPVHGAENSEKLQPSKTKNEDFKQIELKEIENENSEEPIEIATIVVQPNSSLNSSIGVQIDNLSLSDLVGDDNVIIRKTLVDECKEQDSLQSIITGIDHTSISKPSKCDSVETLSLQPAKSGKDKIARDDVKADTNKNKSVLSASKCGIEKLEKIKKIPKECISGSNDVVLEKKVTTQKNKDKIRSPKVKILKGQSENLSTDAVKTVLDKLKVTDKSKNKEQKTSQNRAKINNRNKNSTSPEESRKKLVSDDVNILDKTKEQKIIKAPDDKSSSLSVPVEKSEVNLTTVKTSHPVQDVAPGIQFRDTKTEVLSGKQAEETKTMQSKVINEIIKSEDVTLKEVVKKPSATKSKKIIKRFDDSLSSIEVFTSKNERIYKTGKLATKKIAKDKQKLPVVTKAPENVPVVIDDSKTSAITDDSIQLPSGSLRDKEDDLKKETSSVTDSSKINKFDDKTISAQSKKKLRKRKLSSSNSDTSSTNFSETDKTRTEEKVSSESSVADTTIVENQAVDKLDILENASENQIKKKKYAKSPKKNTKEDDGFLKQRTDNKESSIPLKKRKSKTKLWEKIVSESQNEIKTDLTISELSEIIEKTKKIDFSMKVLKDESIGSTTESLGDKKIELINQSNEEIITTCKEPAIVESQIIEKNIPYNDDAGKSVVNKNENRFDEIDEMNLILRRAIAKKVPESSSTEKSKRPKNKVSSKDDQFGSLVHKIVDSSITKAKVSVLENKKLEERNVGFNKTTLSSSLEILHSNLKQADEIDSNLKDTMARVDDIFKNISEELGRLENSNNTNINTNNNNSSNNISKNNSSNNNNYEKADVSLPSVDQNKLKADGTVRKPRKSIVQDSPQDSIDNKVPDTTDSNISKSNEQTNEQFSNIKEKAKRKNRNDKNKIDKFTIDKNTKTDSLNPEKPPVIMSDNCKGLSDPDKVHIKALDVEQINAPTKNEPNIESSVSFLVQNTCAEAIAKNLIDKEEKDTLKKAAYNYSIDTSKIAKNDITIPEEVEKIPDFDEVAAIEQEFKDLERQLRSGVKPEIIKEACEINTGNFVDIKLNEPEIEISDQTIKEEINRDDPTKTISIQDSDNGNSIRRSHRIKHITQTKSQNVGRGLVKDKERFLIKEDDKILNDPVSKLVDAINQSLLSVRPSEIQQIDAINNAIIEQRLSEFQAIKENEYKCERIISKEAKKMTCDCFLTREEAERGELGCGEDCLNRLLMIECGPKCVVGDRCTNRRFQTNLYAPCNVFRTEKKGIGIMADLEILPGEFIMEYVGEVLSSKQFEKRATIYSQDKNKHYYFMALRSDAIIDATGKGNVSRFINHSCDPNAETQKWTVNGELRIGFFCKKRILPGEEITFDYQFQRYGKEAQKCFCEAESCRGWIGEEPGSEDEDEEDEEIEEEEDIEEEVGEVNIDIDNEKEKSLLEKKQIAETEKDLLNEKIGVIKTEIGDVTMKNLDVNVTELKTNLEKSEQDREQGATSSPFSKPLPIEKKIKRVSPLTKQKSKREHRPKKKVDLRDDVDLTEEIESLTCSGLKNQAHTLRFSRLMVRAKLIGSRIQLLKILCKGEMPCRRLFLDYHGLRLLHGWMIETETTDAEQDLDFRLLIVETLEILPIPNKTMLKDSRVFNTIQNWSKDKMVQSSSPNDSPTNNESNISEICKDDQTNKSGTSPTDVDPTTDEYHPLKCEIMRISTKLITAWEGLPEVFRIPKRERIEQMKEHEREADKQYKALNLADDNMKDVIAKKNKERFGTYESHKRYKRSQNKTENNNKEANIINFDLSKAERRKLFAEQVAKNIADKKEIEERRTFEAKCKFFGLDPLKLNRHELPICWSPETGQWYAVGKKKIPTPPNHLHLQIRPRPKSTNPNDYNIQPMDLPPYWKFAIDSRGKIYYYHAKIRIPQWEPPIKILPLAADGKEELGSGYSKEVTTQTQEEESSETDDTCSDSCTGSENDDDRIELGRELHEAHANDETISKREITGERGRRRRRRALLVQKRTISPRREEDRIYNQNEMKRYRENKEKIRKRKEDIKRKKLQVILKQQETALNSSTNENQEQVPNQIPGIPLPIQDYLISSDEEESIKIDFNTPLMEKFVQGDKIVDEFDALTKEKPLKRALSLKLKSEYKKRTIKIHEKKKSESSKSSSSCSKSSKHRKSDLESSSISSSIKQQFRKAKERFRSDIAGIIVHHLTPYRKDTCKIGKITNTEDFKHLARKLTHFVMIKELKHCGSTGHSLVVTESVKNKSREFIKKYMTKYGEVYVRPENDPEFRDI